MKQLNEIHADVARIIKTESPEKWGLRMTELLAQRDAKLREETLKLKGYLPSKGYFTDLPEGEILVAKSDILALLTNKQN